MDAEMTQSEIWFMLGDCFWEAWKYGMIVSGLSLVGLLFSAFGALISEV